MLTFSCFTVHNRMDVVGYCVSFWKLTMAIFFKLILKEFETFSSCFRHFAMVTLPRNGIPTARLAINYNLPWYFAHITSFALNSWKQRQQTGGCLLSQRQGNITKLTSSIASCPYQHPHSASTGTLKKPRTATSYCSKLSLCGWTAGFLFCGGKNKLEIIFLSLGVWYRCIYSYRPTSSFLTGKHFKILKIFKVFCFVTRLPTCLRVAQVHLPFVVWSLTTRYMEM